MSRKLKHDLCMIVLILLALAYITHEASAGTVDQRWKDRDHNADPTGIRVEHFEAEAPSGAWMPVTATRLPHPPGLPANERVSTVSIPWSGCSNLRLYMTAEGRTQSPYSNVYRVCPTGPAVCDLDANANGVVDLDDMGAVLRGLGSTHTLSDIGVILGGIGEVCR